MKWGSLVIRTRTSTWSCDQEYVINAKRTITRLAMFMVLHFDEIMRVTCVSLAIVLPPFIIRS